MPGNRKVVVGILGGIGSGKTEVSRLLQEAGGVVVSGDALGHEALRQPELKARIVERWGRDILDEKGEIQRRKLAGIVFADGTGKERTALEAMVHPWIKSRMHHEVTELKSRPDVRLIVVDAAIMLEAGWNEVCDELIFIDVPRAVRLERIRQQRDWSEKEVEAREQAQLPLTEKAGRANFTIDNAGSPQELRRQINVLLARWGL